MQLTNNTILITGGSSGIGLALGRKLKALGNQVILLGRNKPKLQELEKEGFHTLVCDLSNEEDIEKTVVRLLNSYPKLNMLFNNAGVQYNYNFLENQISMDKVSKEIAINITGQMLLTQQLIPQLVNSKQALIVNTTSGLGAFPKQDALVYSASKAAMRNFTFGLRSCLADSGVNVVEFIPPVTDTQMTKGRNTAKMSTEKLVDIILPQLKNKRNILTTGKMRLFLIIAFLFPSLAAKIVNK